MGNASDTERELRDRFLSLSSPEPNTGCWIWMGCLTARNYGMTSITGRSVAAHRVAHILFKGPIPVGLVVDHLCRNPWCVNPHHLEAVTNKENILRGFGAPARLARQVVCKRGHEFSPENTHVNRAGARICLSCRTERRKQIYATTGK